MQFRLVLLLVVTVLLTLAPALAANPGHPASSVSSGTFESGNYTFPDTLFVTNNFGLGTTAPNESLDVLGGNIRTDGAMILDGADGLWLNAGSTSGSSPTPGIFYSGTTDQGWYFQVPNNGQEKFSVKLPSNDATRQFRVVNSTFGSLFQVQGNGRVAINGTNPQGTLDINGTLCIYGDCISSWSGVSTSESEVEGWIFDSDNTGTLNTTGNIIATNITGSGLLTIGSINTGQGSNELFAMNQDVKTTDGVNFASVTTTGAITAGAKVTGSNLIDDGTNLVLGSFVNNSAASSTFIGSGSTGQHNTGTYVTAVGLASAYSNSGSSTTFVGDGAGSNNAADYVTAIGAGAGQGNSGEYAISVGLASGGSNTGNRTILIGYQAGDSNSGSDVIAFGYQAGVSNTLANRFIVQQNNINTTPLLYGDFLNNRLGIGNSDTTPDYTLDVAGTINADTQLCIGGDCISAWSSISGTSTNFTVAGDSGSTEFTDGETLTLDGQNSIVTAVSGSTATIDVVDDSINGSELADTIALDANLAITGANVSFDTTVLVVDSGADRVGVRTATPSETLDINGSFKVSNTAGSWDAIKTDATTGYVGVGTDPSSTYVMSVVNNVNAEGMFFYTQNNVLTSERDAFVIKSDDSLGASQDESSVLKVWQAGSINAAADGFSLVELTASGTVNNPVNRAYYILGRRTDEGTVSWGVDLVSSNIWTSGSIAGGATGTNCGASNAPCFNTPSFYFNASGVSYFASGSSLGVNTSSPSYTLDVAGTINAGNQLCIGAACISSWADVNTSVPDESSIEGYIFDTDNTFSGNFSLNTNDLFLDSSKGYLGIGTTVPSQQLEVSNSTQSFTFNPGGYNNSPQINTTVGTDLVLSSGSGNVVIVIG